MHLVMDMGGAPVAHVDWDRRALVIVGTCDVDDLFEKIEALWEHGGQDGITCPLVEPPGGGVAMGRGWTITNRRMLIGDLMAGRR